MDVGEKLKNARVAKGYTQEEIAEKLKVTRQTISNWENIKSYPDVLQIIQLSELYSISLDELVKEDEKMVKHLERSTNIVKSRKRIIQFLSLGLYFIIWAILILWFWCGGAVDSPFGYSLFVFYLISPSTIFVTSFILGTILNHKGWFFISIVYGIFYSLTQLLTFSFKSTYHFSDLTTVDFYMFLFGVGFSLTGLLTGFLFQILYKKKRSKSL